MINAISIRDINSISIQEDSDGRITFVFEAEDEYLNIDCDIPPSLNMIISSDRQVDDSILLSTIFNEVMEVENDTA